MKTTTQPRILNRQDFQLLLNHEGSPCISMFLPTHRTGREQQQDEIRLKNLLARAKKELCCSDTFSGDMDSGDMERLLEPIKDLLSDIDFWQHQSDGLAIFRSADLFRCHRLPLRFTEQCLVGNRFYVKPLLRLLHTGGRFFVLALSQDSARLFEATRDSIHEVELPEIAHAKVDRDDSALQFHSQRRGTRASSDEAIYHGHGGNEARTKTNALNFFYSLIGSGLT